MLPISFFFSCILSGIFESLQVIRKTNLIEFQFHLNIIVTAAATDIAKTLRISLRLFRGQLYSLSGTGSFHEMIGYAVNRVTLSCGLYCSWGLGIKTRCNTGAFPPLSNNLYHKSSFQGPCWVFLASKKVV